MLILISHALLWLSVRVSLRCVDHSTTRSAGRDPNARFTMLLQLVPAWWRLFLQSRGCGAAANPCRESTNVFFRFPFLFQFHTCTNAPFRFPFSFQSLLESFPPSFPYKLMQGRVPVLPSIGETKRVSALITVVLIAVTEDQGKSGKTRHILRKPPSLTPS